MLIKSDTILNSELSLSEANISNGYSSNLSTENPDRWRGSFHAGFSPYLGMFGLELQNLYVGFILGMPTSIGFRYYLNGNGHKWFLGVHGMHYNLESDKTLDGITYNKSENTLFGSGFGYKWRWKGRYDLALSLSLAYQKNIHTNDHIKRTEDGIMIFPGFTFGFLL